MFGRSLSNLTLTYFFEGYMKSKMYSNVSLVYTTNNERIFLKKGEINCQSYEHSK